MKKYSFIIFLMVISNYSFGQEVPNKTEKFDSQIFEYLSQTIERDSVSLETFLEYSKPFSKWDVRPLKYEKVFAMENVHSASEIPNFFWGGFSDYYKLSIEEAMKKPNVFLNTGSQKQNELADYLKTNSKKFEKLSKLILKSSNKIFLNQKSIQRIDEIFNENNVYWKYVIPNKSPFPISNKTENIKNYKFTSEQKNILESLIELNIYSAIKTESGIFYLVDGFTDNSYGFYFSSKEKMEEDNFLFEIMKYDKINNNYFYYIAN